MGVHPNLTEKFEFLFSSKPEPSSIIDNFGKEFYLFFFVLFASFSHFKIPASVHRCGHHGNGDSIFLFVSCSPPYS